MSPSDEAEPPHWLVDYQVTDIGCSPDDVDFEASLKDVGVGSPEVAAALPPITCGDSFLDAVDAFDAQFFVISSITDIRSKGRVRV